MTREENEKRIAYLKNIALSLPDAPGSYQFLDENGIIIYVGKAKNLKNRVATYFHTEVDRYKTKVLVNKIHTNYRRDKCTAAREQSYKAV